MTIQDILRGYRLDVLKSIAVTRKIEMNAKRKEPFVAELAEKLFTPEGVREAFAKLTDIERKVFLRLLRAPGSVDTEDLIGRLEETKVIASEPRLLFSVRRLRKPTPSSQGPPTFSSIFARLNSLGLAFNVPSDTGPHLLHKLVPGKRVIVPERVRQHIPAETILHPTVQVDGLDIRRSAPDVLQRDLYFYWSYVRDHPLSLTTKGLVSKRDLNKINAVLVESQDLQRARTEETAGRLHLLRLLLQKLGLLLQKGDEVHHNEREPAFFGGTTFERTQRVYQHWLQLSDWNEIRLIPDLRVRGMNRSPSSPLPNARQAIIKLLSDLFPEQWTKMEDFIETVRDVDRDFLLTRTRQYGYISSPYSSYLNPLGWDFNVYEEKKGWRQVEARLIEQFLSGPLFWMGVIALAYQGDTAVAFQVTSFGAQVLGLRPPPKEEPPSTGRLVVQPNFDLLAMDGVSDRVLAQLDRFADRIRQERVLEYRLSRASVYRAQQSGMQVQEILTVLESESDHPVPQNVRYALEEWDRLYNQIVFRPRVSLCQVADPAVLDALQHDKTFRRALIRRVRPTLALLRGTQGRMENLLNRLTEKGHMPILTSMESPSPRVQDRVHIASDGRLTPAYTTFALSAHRGLSAFAEDQGGVLCLTQASIEAAVERGMTVDRILEVLRHFVAGDLPRSVTEAVRRWGNYFGTLRIEKPVLLTVENEKLLKELRADPDLRPLLNAFKPTHAVAVVKKGRLAQLRKVLKEKGIKVE